MNGIVAVAPMRCSELLLGVHEIQRFQPPPTRIALRGVAEGITMNLHSLSLQTPNILHGFDLCDIFAKYSV